MTRGLGTSATIWGTRLHASTSPSATLEQVTITWDGTGGGVDNSAIGVPVLASAPGDAGWVGEFYTGYGDGYAKQVTIYHPATDHQTGSGHLYAYVVRLGQPVYRGQIIGLLGMSGSSWAHVHFAFHPGWENRQIGTPKTGDPFRDIQDPSSLCYWTKDNDPQFPLVSLGD